MVNTAILIHNDSIMVNTAILTPSAIHH